MDLHSPHLVNQNIERIAQLFPNCVTESAEGLKIDFDQLRQELSGDIIVTRKQKYSENGNRGTAKSGTRIQ